MSGAAQRTWRIALVGTGIGPSLSPALHEREAAAQGLEHSYVRWDLDVLGVAPHEVGGLVARARREGLAGLNVTHPCKQLVLAHLDGVSEEAAALGSVNTVVLTDAGAFGHTTDGSGFARSFDRGLPAAPRGHVVLVGAGGAGAAVAHALLVAGTRRLTIVDVDPVRAVGLAAALGDRFPARSVVPVPHAALGAVLPGADGVVHATPTGMAGHPGVPFDVGLLAPAAWVADVVYRPLATRLVREARAAGHPVLDGGGMAVFQAAESFRLFTGLDPDVGRMLAHFAELVADEPLTGPGTP